ncbi:pirin family protein [Marinihelvus fidelis]|uniref:Pirin family protein n=1 Tax=Marinihelvus fidelis TaxID=2613842 RepID=A0A5N0TC54_9GAMM|nr:pirin family protein [Marinihelvus fidelis]KAA9132602.1 pirin family protein [Marinihelvus fidelis]
MSLQYLDNAVHDMGGFTVRRALPSGDRQHVGPFVFFDHIGPATFAPGEGIDVRPHPHIGLATVTYLFEGEIYHRDSLGNALPIRPGAVNWMVAGRGIVHSERTDDAERARQANLHGIQLWVGLPLELEETKPSFRHYPAEDIPGKVENGLDIRVITGDEFGLSSPVETQSPMFYTAVKAEQPSTLTLPARSDERAVYVAHGRVRLGGETVEAGQMALITDPGDLAMGIDAGAMFLYFGGQPLKGPRYKHWNFVSSSRERISQARDDWAEGRFDPVPGDDEFIPLPEKVRL